MVSYDNSVFNISASILSILVFQYMGLRSYFGGNYQVKLSKYSIQGSQLFENSFYNSIGF